MRWSVRLEDALRTSAAWQAADGIDELAEAATDDLLRLVPADGAGWNEVRLRPGAVRILASPVDCFPSRHERLGDLIDENPLVAERFRTGGAAHTFSDFLSVRDYHRREIYSEVYRPYAIEDQLAALVAVTPDTVVGVALNRSRRTFTDGDRTLLDHLRIQLVAAYRTVLARSQARARLAALEHGLDDAGAGVIALDAHGRAADATARGRRLLLSWFGNEPPAPGSYRRDDAVLAVRRIDGETPLLLLEEQRTTPSSTRVGTFGLTPREVEAVTLAGRGLTNRQIAETLFLSERTVQKHLERAFGKLGAHNRTEAALRLLESE